MIHDTFRDKSRHEIIDSSSHSNAKVSSINHADDHTIFLLERLRDEVEDEKTFSDLCQLFVTNVPKCMKKIDAMIENSDWTNLRGVLHNLKGTMQVFHMNCKTLIEMNNLCRATITTTNINLTIIPSERDTMMISRLEELSTQLRSELEGVLNECEKLPCKI